MLQFMTMAENEYNDLYTKNTVTFINLPMSKLSTDINAQELAKLVSTPRKMHTIPKSNLLLALGPSVGNYLIINHFMKESILTHLKYSKSLNRGIFTQAEVFGRKVIRDQLEKPEMAVSVLESVFQDFITNEPKVHKQNWITLIKEELASFARLGSMETFLQQELNMISYRDRA